MGVVWRGRDELLDRDVAVKEVIWPASLADHERQTAGRRATREAQIAARLNHRNVILVYDIVEEDDHPWIVMELLPYKSLRDILREKGPLPPAQAAEVGLQILAALDAAHAEGIAHRDVKPANILIGSENRVVLTDFGIARAADTTTLTTTGILIGSPAYIAPERARGGKSGAPGDLWGLGASLYAAVEGHPPFDRDNALATLTAVVADEPEPATHAGPLWPVIKGLLRKNPEERLGAAEAEHMLRRVAASEAAEAVASKAPPTEAMVAEPAGAPPEAPEPEPPAHAESESYEPTPSEPVSSKASAAEAAPAGAVPAEPTPPEPAAAKPALAMPVAVGLDGLLSAEPRVPPRPRFYPKAQVSREPQDSSEPPVSSGSRRSRRPRTAMLGAAALAVIAAGATALALVLTSSPPRQTASPPVGTRSSSSASQHPSSGTSSSGSPASSATANPGAGNGAIPDGFYRFTNSTGFSIGVPNGWQISHVGHYVYITDPDNGGIFLLIDQSDNPKPDPLADWEQQQANRESSYQDYHLIRLEAVSYPQAEKAADWEFTYDKNGVPVHVLNRNILANAHHAYALYWSTPESDWNAYFRYFQAFATTFRPAPA
jgi:eukaryotic-like serine/threonine-protein kinase